MVREEISNEERESFFMRITGDFYDFVSDIAAPVVLIGTPIFFVLFGLTFICHWDIVRSAFSVVSGFSLLFIAYIISLIFMIDRVLLYKVNRTRPPKYTTTVVWGVALISLGITTCILTNNYKKQYFFDCMEWYVDEDKGLYHWDGECENMGDDTYIARGYEIRNSGLNLCDYCKDVMDDYGSYEPIRRP